MGNRLYVGNLAFHTTEDTLKDHFAGIGGVTEAVIDSYVRTSAPGNLTGLPAMSVPCGFSEGLPIGAQIIGRPYDEATVLRIGSVAESTYAEAGRMPQL